MAIATSPSIWNQMPLFGCLASWIILAWSTRIKTERKDVPETHYQIPLHAFMVTGGLAGALIYGLSLSLTGIPLLYFSSILVLLLAQATIDFLYKEIALEWIALSLVIHIAYIRYEGSYSHHMLGFMFMIFVLMLLCSIFAGLGVGDTLLLTANSILFYPGTFNRIMFTYVIGFRWFFLVFAIPQVLVWMYFSYKKRKETRPSKAEQSDKPMTLPFIPFYTVSFVIWLFGMILRR